MISPYTGEVVPIAPVAPPDRAATPLARRGGRGSAAEAAPDRRGRGVGAVEEADAEENTGKVKAVVPESEDDIEIDETIEDDDDDDSTSSPTRKKATRT